jgi:hypothetical protein
MHDTDCAAGQACACHGSTYTFGAGSTCIQGNCPVDSDCGDFNPQVCAYSTTAGSWQCQLHGGCA